MRAVVTRPIEDAERLAAPLRDRGVEVVIEPLLAVVTAAAAEVSMDGVQAFLLTSANGARALAAALKDVPHGFAMPTLCVGDQTQQVARTLGFTQLFTAGGDVASLAALVRRTLRPEAGTLVHAAGSMVAGDLQDLLQDDGFTVHRQPLYETRTAKGFSDALQTLLREGAIDCVLLYSPRTARTFTDLATQADLRDACRGITAYCLSQAVADALGDLPVGRRRVALEPSQHALLAAFDADNPTGAMGVSLKGERGRATDGTTNGDPEGDGTMTERPEAGQGEQGKDAKSESQPGKTVDPQAPGASGPQATAPGGTPDKPKAGDPGQAGDKADDKSGSKSGASSAAGPAKSTSSVPPSKSAPPKTTGTSTSTTPSGASSAGSKPAAGKSSSESAAAKPQSRGVSGGIVAVLVGLVVLLGLWATLPLWRGTLPEAMQRITAPLVPGAEGGAQVADLQARLDDADRQLARLSDTVNGLRQRVSDLEARPTDATPPTSSPTPPDMADGATASSGTQAEVQARLQALDERLETLAAKQPQGLEDEIATLQDRIGELQASRAEASTVLTLSDRVGRVEEALRQQQARQTRAIAFLLSVGQLRTAIDGGRSFTDDLRSVRAVAPEGLDMVAATEGWASFSDEGVPTLTGLRQAFAEKAAAIVRASVDLDAGTGWWERTMDRVMSVVSVRRTDGDAVGDGAAAVVSRAERDLATGALAAAVAEVDKLSGAPAQVAADWLTRAKARLAADQSLSALIGEALARLQAAESQAPEQDPAGAGAGTDTGTGTTGREG